MDFGLGVLFFTKKNCSRFGFTSGFRFRFVDFPRDSASSTWTRTGWRRELINVCNRQVWFTVWWSSHVVKVYCCYLSSFLVTILVSALKSPFFTCHKFHKINIQLLLLSCCFIMLLYHCCDIPPQFSAWCSQSLPLFTFIAGQGVRGAAKWTLMSCSFGALIFSDAQKIRVPLKGTHTVWSSIMCYSLVSL